ncbi:unnamed protein product [Albugo candida]|uniref:Uncharacterized protein n=1 Tax=Albugo candida TaxID=65357 RepID=A0A024G843_9STRA|nr:unnamed protein product [Albugo candida]|eukprot:CCI42735.1 unnamed protein product [Albugo candida]
MDVRDLKAGPLTRVCHVCGRQYGLSSFDIHLKQCKKLWIAQEELKPRGERKPLPKTPPKAGGARELESDPSGSKPMTRDEVEAMNKAASEAYNVHGMEKCENCGRTFAEGRLAIHSKSCRPGNVAKKIDDGAQPRNKAEVVDYGRVKTLGNKTEATKDPPKPLLKSPPTTRPSTPSSPPSKDNRNAVKPLSGNLASNRKQTPTQIQLSMQSSLAIDSTESDAGLLNLIHSNLDKWEATTLNTLQEIRALKQIISSKGNAQ